MLCALLFAQVALGFLFDTIARRCEAVVQRRSLPPIPVTVSFRKNKNFSILFDLGSGIPSLFRYDLSSVDGIDSKSL
jgi:hypothetical protein